MAEKVAYLEFMNMYLPSRHLDSYPRCNSVGTTILDDAQISFFKVLEGNILRRMDRMM